MRSIPYILNFHCCFPCFHFHLHAGGNLCSFKFLYVILRKMPAAKKGGTPPPRYVPDIKQNTNDRCKKNCVCIFK